MLFRSHYPNFESILNLIRSHRDVKLLLDVEAGVRLESYQPGRIAFTPSDLAPQDLAQRLGSRLQAWTGNRWAISLTNSSDAATVQETRDAETRAIRQEAETHPLVQAVVMQFPGAKILDVKTSQEQVAEAAVEALEEVSEE